MSKIINYSSFQIKNFFPFPTNPHQPPQSPLDPPLKRGVGRPIAPSPNPPIIGGQGGERGLGRGREGDWGGSQVFKGGWGGSQVFKGGLVCRMG
jgi:hypothetical protein